MGLSSALGGIANLASAVTSTITANSANKKAKRAAEAERNWEAYMSNTAHQREVKDLKAAGLNPILSAGGSGATTPSTEMANSANTGNLDLLNGINTMLNYEIAKQNANTQTKVGNAEKAKAEAETLGIQIRNGLIQPETIAKIKNMNSATSVSKAEKALKEAQTTAEKGGKGGYPIGKIIEGIENNALDFSPKGMIEGLKNLYKIK